MHRTIVQPKFFTYFFIAFLFLGLAFSTSCKSSGGGGSSDDGTTAAKSSDKAITSFTFLAANNGQLSSDVIGTIDESAKTIALALPYGSDPANRADLIASFTITGETVEVSTAAQISDTTINDFTAPIT